MVVENGETDRTTLTCNSPEGVAQGALFLTVGGDAEDPPRTYGVAPDGVERVKLTDSTGNSIPAGVENNVYVVNQVAALARVEWTDDSGSRADLRLPAP